MLTLALKRKDLSLGKSFSYNLLRQASVGRSHLPTRIRELIESR
jgi:hypothetical protein